MIDRPFGDYRGKDTFLGVGISQICQIVCVGNSRTHNREYEKEGVDPIA